MKKVRVELDIVLEIDVDEQDEDKAMQIAEMTAISNLYDNYHGECILDNNADGIYMASAASRAIDCEEVEYDG